MRQGNSKKTSGFFDRLHTGVTIVLVIVLLSLWLFSSLVMTFDRPLASDQEGMFFCALLGAYVSRLPTVALLVVLLPGSLLFRALLAMLLFPTEALFVVVAFRELDPAVILLAIPLTVVGFALPFELARLFWNAHLEVDWFDGLRRRQYGLGELLIWTTMTAALLGLLRFFDQQTAVGLLSATCVAAAIGGIVLLPFTIKLLTGRYRVLWFVVFVMAAVLLCYFAVDVFAQFTNPMSGWAIWSAPVGLATLLLSYGLALAVLTRLGLRLSFDEADNAIVLKH